MAAALRLPAVSGTSGHVAENVSLRLGASKQLVSLQVPSHPFSCPAVRLAGRAAVPVRAVQTPTKEAEAAKKKYAEIVPPGPNKVQELFTKGGQSPWIDNLSRGWIESGFLADLIERGVRGMTSNPTIFQKAIESSDEYDEQYRALLKEHGASAVKEEFWEMVIKDIDDAAQIMTPLYKESQGGDGYVSIEVAPALARDTAGTIEMARDFHRKLNSRENVLVKIPATAEGVPAIETMIAEGVSVNVTLIFSLTRYGEVMDAYINGLEKYGGELGKVSSVASFFVSRVDTEVDARLDKIGSPEAKALLGKVAVAQAQAAYQLFKEKFSGPRWEALAAKGAKVQKALWASTGTKNKSYKDTLYVDSLIGPDTVNTMPDGTLKAFADHGTVERTVDADPESAKATLAKVKELGIDMEEVAEVLEKEGVDKFAESFDHLIESLEKKAKSWGMV